mgnify:CR=1 FL=1
MVLNLSAYNRFVMALVHHSYTESGLKKIESVFSFLPLVGGFDHFGCQTVPILRLKNYFLNRFSHFCHWYSHANKMRESTHSTATIMRAIRFLLIFVFSNFLNH